MERPAAKAAGLSLYSRPDSVPTPPRRCPSRERDTEVAENRQVTSRFCLCPANFRKIRFLPGSRALECRLAFGLICLKTRTTRIKTHCGVFIAVGFSKRSSAVPTSRALGQISAKAGDPQLLPLTVS